MPIISEFRSFFILTTGKGAETVHCNNTYTTDAVDRVLVTKKLKPHVWECALMYKIMSIFFFFLQHLTFSFLTYPTLAFAFMSYSFL